MSREQIYDPPIIRLEDRLRAHRKHEREFVKSAKQALTAGDYAEAAKFCVWAMQQSSWATAAENALKYQDDPPK